MLLGGVNHFLPFDVVQLSRSALAHMQPVQVPPYCSAVCSTDIPQRYAEGKNLTNSPPSKAVGFFTPISSQRSNDAPNAEAPELCLKGSP